MDERLHLQPGLRDNVADLIKRQLPGRYDARQPFFFQNLCSVSPGHGHLCACMDRKLWKILFQETHHTEILYNHAVQSLTVIRADIIIQLLLQLSFLQKCIHGQIQFSSMQMTVIDPAQQHVFLRVIRISSGPKSAAANIDSIRSRIYRRIQALIASRRRK